MKKLILLLLGACASLQPAQPTGEIVATALSTKKEAASVEAKALARAALFKDGVLFVLDRRTKTPALKLAKSKPQPGLSAVISPRAPAGVSARIVIVRTPDELSKLSRLNVAHVEGEGTSSDPGKAQLKAEAEAFIAAITRTAKVQGRQEQVLKGKMQIVNLSMAEEGRLVTLIADIAVAFQAVKVVSAPVVAAIPQTVVATAAPASRPTRVRDADEPGDDGPPVIDPVEPNAPEMVFDTSEMVFE